MKDNERKVKKECSECEFRMTVDDWVRCPNCGASRKTFLDL
ncbi:MAG: hypothetical protein R6U61_04940 [Thermoplasmata archaeon]